MFIDEIHRLNVSIEEILYSAMEDYRLDILIGQGPSARTMQIDLVPFTLVSHYKKRLIIKPSKGQIYGYRLHYDFYEPEDLSKFLDINSSKLNIKLSEEAKAAISTRSKRHSTYCQ